MFPQWQGETQEFCPNAKVVLVGCKLDMRTDVNTLRELSKQRLIPVTHEQVRSTDLPKGARARLSGKSDRFTTMDVGGRGTTERCSNYAQYFPSRISGGVAFLMKSHKSECERGLAPHKQPLQNQSRGKSLWEDSLAWVFGSSFVDK